MDELESRLDHQLSGLGRVPLAEPVPVDDLRRRARHIRAARVLTSVVAVVAAVAVTGALVVVAHNGSSSTDSQNVRIAAPDFVLGDIDAVVLSSGLDADGARQPIPQSLVAVVARVPGVQTVSGVVDTFAPVVPENAPASSFTATGVPPRSPILFSYHEGDDVPIASGRAPAAAGEIVVDADVLTRENVQVGDDVHLQVRDQDLKFKIVGTFELPGVDLTGIPLAAMSVAFQPADLQFDRIDVKMKPGANETRVRDAINLATGSAYSVVPPSVISFPDQRLAQLEIQHAYWALLSPDAKERSTSGDGPPSAQEKANYAKYAQLSTMVELRVENVAFLSPDAAALTYRIYYGGSPSPVIHEVQTGTATRVDGHWQLGSSTLCSLAALVGIKCDNAEHVTISPPNGYEPVSTLNPEVLGAFNALADPTATLAQRVAAIAGGNAQRSIIEAGLEQDQAYAGKTQFTIAGWRANGPGGVSILYSLQTAGGPSTPWPTNAIATQAADGHWYAGSQYACGINGLAGACPSPTRPDLGPGVEKNAPPASTATAVVGNP